MKDLLTMQNENTNKQEESLDIKIQNAFLQELKDFLSDPYYTLNLEAIGRMLSQSLLKKLKHKTFVKEMKYLRNKQYKK